MFFFLLGMHLIEMSLISIGISFNLRIKKFRFTFISKYDELIIANLNDNHFVDIKRSLKIYNFHFYSKDFNPENSETRISYLQSNQFEKN